MDNDRPFCRATITAGTITLNPWTPCLISSGPSAMLLDALAQAGVALADLVQLDDRELLVRLLPGSASGEEIVDTLLDWAARVGYARVWLPDRVVDLGDHPAPVGTARVRCPTCSLEWRDSTPEFWQSVRAEGWFPGFCVACGGSLPEWDFCRRG